jgi:glycosyltransferase involved in cell wall biosynthesis
MSNSEKISITTPLITVITVVYNSKSYIRRTIESILDQSYKNIEYIIIDGNSNDGTIDIIKEYSPHISFWISENDNGIYDAMNKGISLASGEWINFMNAGDIFYCKKTIEDIFNKKPFANIIYGDVETVYNDYSIIHKAGNIKKITQKMQFSHQSAFIKRNFHTKKYYDINFSLSSDFKNIVEWYIEDQNNFQYIPLVVSSVNVRGASSLYEYESASQRYIIIKQLMKLNIIKTNINLIMHYTLLLIKLKIKSKISNDKLIDAYRNFKHMFWKKSHD